MSATAAAAASPFGSDAVQLELRPTRPDDERIRPLLQALDDYIYRQYPAEEFGQEPNRILDVQALLHPSFTFVAAWDGDEALGCGAVRRAEDGQGRFGEIKRMYVRPEARGQRVAERLLEELEAVMRAEGVSRLFLETGTRQPEALRLYERCGWRRCPAFGGYERHPANVFMEKQL